MLLLGRGALADANAQDDRRQRKPLGNSWRNANTPSDTREDGIVGESVAWRYVMFRVDQVAETQATVLLLGETGTGKELVARAIHDQEPTPAQSIRRVNCSALPATLIESELFGRERGAFTGANAARPDASSSLTAAHCFSTKLATCRSSFSRSCCRVLQEGQLDRLGSTHTTNIDVRVIAATNRESR